MRLRHRETRAAAEPPAAEAEPESLSRQLADAEAERDRTAAAAESFQATIEERLRELDGRESLGEIESPDAAQLRGDLLSERDAKTAEADRARRAAEYVQGRLVEAAEAAATALKAQPISVYRAAEAQRHEAAAILAARERDVAEARARFAEVEAAGEEIRERYIASAREAKERRAREHADRIRWALPQSDSYVRGLYGERFVTELHAARAEHNQAARERSALMTREAAATRLSAQAQEELQRQEDVARRRTA